MCVTLGIAGILLDCLNLFCKAQGVQAVVSWPWTNEDGLTTGEARRYLLQFLSFRKGLLSSAVMSGRRHPVDSSHREV